MIAPDGRLVLLSTLVRLLDGLFRTHIQTWRRPRRTLVNNGGLDTYLYVTSKRKPGEPVETIELEDTEGSAKKKKKKQPKDKDKAKKKR